MFHSKLYISIFCLCIIFFLSVINQVHAAPACCVNHGGEYACDYTNGVLYCKDGTVSTDCTCKIINTPTPSLSPTPTPIPSLSLPECVVNSTFNKKTKLCHCDPGFTVYEKTCISYEQYCWKKFGGNSIFNEEKNACTCSSGYSWNSDVTKCISYNKICQNELGQKSYYDGTNKTCNCFSGYIIKEKKCQIVPTKTIDNNKQTTSKALPSPSVVPEPTINEKFDSSPTPTIFLNIDEAKIIKNEENDNNFISEEKNENKNIISKLMNKLKEYIINILS